MTTDEPDPAKTAGLEAGGETAPGDTPPSAGSQTEAVESGSGNAQPPPRGGRGPAVVGLVFIALVTLALLGYTLFEIGGYLFGDAGDGSSGG